MILSRVNKSSAAEPESALEKFTTWIYTDPENLDLRVEVLEAVVKVLRESPIAHPATEAEKFPL